MYGHNFKKIEKTVKNKLWKIKISRILFIQLHVKMECCILVSSWHFYSRQNKTTLLPMYCEVIRKCGIQFSWLSARALSRDNYTSDGLITRVRSLILHKLYIIWLKFIVLNCTRATLSFNIILKTDEWKNLILELDDKATNRDCTYYFKSSCKTIRILDIIDYIRKLFIINYLFRIFMQDKNIHTLYQITCFLLII